MSESAQQWFHPIAGARAHEQVIEQLVFAVRAGVFRPGDPLPRIEELAHALRVSKPTVGEAVGRLADVGVLEARRGSLGGVWVTSDSIPVNVLRAALEPDEIGIRALLEARRPIEMDLARLVGERATEADLAALRAAVDELDVLDREVERARWLHTDHLFHYLMGRAARSEMLAGYQHKMLVHLFVHLHDYFLADENPDSVRAMHPRRWRHLHDVTPVRSAMRWTITSATSSRRC